MNNKILLINRDEDTCQGLTQLLTQESYDITVCRDGFDGLQRAITEPYQLIMSDVSLPSLSGFELLKKLRANTQTPVMMYSSREDSFDRIYALELGADDYIVKGGDRRELVARINAIVRRMQSFKSGRHSQQITVNKVTLSLATREVYSHDMLLSLTGLEFEVLRFLMVNAGHTIAKNDIAQQVLRREVSYYDRSIDMHISNIRKKIAKTTKDVKIKTVRGVGYIFLPGLD